MADEGAELQVQSGAVLLSTMMSRRGQAVVQGTRCVRRMTMELHALTGEAVAREMAKGVSRQEACCADLAMANARHHANAHYALSHIEPDSRRAPSVPQVGTKQLAYRHVPC